MRLSCPAHGKVTKTVPVGVGGCGGQGVGGGGGLGVDGGPGGGGGLDVVGW